MACDYLRSLFPSCSRCISLPFAWWMPFPAGAGGIYPVGSGTWVVRVPCFQWGRFGLGVCMLLCWAAKEGFCCLLCHFFPQAKLVIPGGGILFKFVIALLLQISLRLNDRDNGGKCMVLSMQVILLVIWRYSDRDNGGKEVHELSETNAWIQ